jgi:nitrile hydratase subunit beta
MNSVHDLGGMDGFGPVEVEANEPVFHETWERRVFGTAAAMALQRPRLYRTDTFRHAIERMDPVHYLSSSYYEHWLTGLATLLIEKGVVTGAELDAKCAGRFPLSQPVRHAAPPIPPSVSEPRFAVGAAVIVRNLHPLGHTRCPRYVRGKRGAVARVDERSPLPDVAAHSDQPCEQYSYNVRFDGRELWGANGGAAEAVHIDLWESYLETP